VLHGQDLAVVDAMNFRVQVFDRSGGFKYAVARSEMERIWGASSGRKGSGSTAKGTYM